MEDNWGLRQQLEHAEQNQENIVSETIK